MFEWLETRSASQPAPSSSSRRRPMRPGTSIGARSLLAKRRGSASLGPGRQGHGPAGQIAMDGRSPPPSWHACQPMSEHEPNRLPHRADVRANARADARADARTDAWADGPAPPVGP